MRLLRNADVLKVLDMATTVDALRAGYADLAGGDAAFIPRIDLYAPTGREADYYRWGSMSGACRAYGVMATRMKSDVVSWPDGRTEEKYCVEPGTYCGLILLFSLINGEPLGIIQDGCLQHMRVGGSAGIGVDALANPDTPTLGLLGSGGMAKTMLEAVAHVRDLTTIKVYSPTVRHREQSASAMSEQLDVEVVCVEEAQLAVDDADIVLSATDSLEPTFQPSWLKRGSTVVTVSRREVSSEMLDVADQVFQLGISSIPPGAAVPDMEWSLQGKAAYVTGSAHERARLPAQRKAERHQAPLLTDVMAGRIDGRRSSDEIVLYLNGGTQGLQFAAVAGRVMQLATERGLGQELPTEWFLQDIRD